MDPTPVHMSCEWYRGYADAMRKVVLFFNLPTANCELAQEIVLERLQRAEAYARNVANPIDNRNELPVAPSKPFSIWLHERLRDPVLAAGYLQAHLKVIGEPDGKQLLALALRDIAEANGVLPDISEEDVKDA